MSNRLIWRCANLPKEAAYAGELVVDGIGISNAECLDAWNGIPRDDERSRPGFRKDLGISIARAKTALFIRCEKREWLVWPSFYFSSFVFLILML